jgi:hypothetical protein
MTYYTKVPNSFEQHRELFISLCALKIERTYRVVHGPVSYYTIVDLGEGPILDRYLPLKYNPWWKRIFLSPLNYFFPWEKCLSFEDFLEWAKKHKKVPVQHKQYLLDF